MPQSKTTTLDTWSKAFSRSTNIKYKFLFLALDFSVNILLGLRGSPFLSKIGTYELNIHSSGNLSLNKISWKIFLKDFKHLFPPTSSISFATPEGPLALPVLHTAPFNLNAPHHTLYCTSINAITPSIFNIHELFHILFLDFCSIINTYFHHSTFISKTTNPNNIFFLSSPFLAILNNSQQSWHDSAFSTAYQAF